MIPKHIPGVDMRLDLGGSREQEIKEVNRMFTVIKRHAYGFDFDDITCFCHIGN